MYVLQYEHVARARLYDNAVCGQRLGCLGDIVCTSATGIRRCVDRGFIVREKWRASPIGNMMIFMRMSEVTLWRDGMQMFYCDEVFGGWEGCVPRAVVAEERLRGKRDLS